MLDYDEADRAAWDATLVAALSVALPTATWSWTEDGRRLTATFPDGRSESIWEPNFYFCRTVYYTDVELFSRAAQHLAGAQANAETFARLVQAAPKLLAACAAYERDSARFRESTVLFFDEAFEETAALVGEALAAVRGDA